MESHAHVLHVPDGGTWTFRVRSSKDLRNLGLQRVSQAVRREEEDPGSEGELVPGTSSWDAVGCYKSPSEGDIRLCTVRGTFWFTSTATGRSMGTDEQSYQ